MICKRYADSLNLIDDVNELELINETQVLIYREDKWHDEIVIDLEEQATKFEELKFYIVFIAQNLWKMDSIAQKYSALHDGDSRFADGYEVAYILLDTSDRIKLRYYGTNENTEFDVVFQHINGELILKSFGMIENIPLDWNRE